MKTAVVYWSASGNTEAMANAVAEGAKAVVLFGSYGWGDGQWLRDWEERCKGKQITLKADSVMCQEMPDDDGLEECRNLGKALVS